MKFINSQKKTQQGFTLIELVVVIVILGILAVTAVPKFIDVSADARKSVMEGVEGSIESAMSMVNAKAIIQSKLDADEEIEINGQFYALVNGYPSAKGKGTPAGTTGNGWGIIQLIDASAAITKANGTATAGALFQHSEAGTAAECQLSYADTADSDIRPVITSTFTDC
jgi:MSHA pilin protein MshA